MHIAPVDHLRCEATTVMADGSGARCMRRRVIGCFCRQHRAMFDKHETEHRNKALARTYRAGCPRPE